MADTKKKDRHKMSSQEHLMENIDKQMAKETAATKAANVTALQEPEDTTVNRIKSTAKEICTAMLAVLVGSLATVSVMIPNGLTFGGITGIARIVQYYTGWSYSLIYYALALAIMCIVWVALGFGEVRKIILLTLTYPAMMFVLEVNNVVLLKSDDLFLVSVFCGVLLGISTGLTFKAGFSSGGSDSLAKVIKYCYLPHLGLNEITFVINALVVVASAFVFGINIALYAVIMTYVSMKAGDAIMYGFGDKIVQLDIIAGDPEALTKFIMDELGRGASSIEITGEYTGDRRKQIKILCSPRESFIIRRYLAQNDAKSFVTVTSIKSVWGSGRGFSDIHKVDD